MRYLLNSGYFEVWSVQGLYSEPVLEAVMNLFKGTAAGLVRYMRPQVEEEGIISKLEAVYRIVASFNVLIQSFYKISQYWNEKIPTYTTMIEETLGLIRLKYPDRIDMAAMEGN